MSGLLRVVRRQRGLTLEELATRSSLTKSYLSKVERGYSVPSIAAALKIAHALDVDVAQLFSENPEIGTLSIERAVERGTDRHHPIATNLLGKAMSPFIVRPARRFTAHPHPTHPGQEFVFVHTGAVELDHDGVVTLLQTGDCAYFDSSSPHRLRQIGDTPATVVVIVANYDHNARR